MKKTVLICLLLAVCSAHSQTAAKVLYKNNTAFLQRNAQNLDVSRGTLVRVADAILTKVKAMVKIKFANGTLVNIGPNSNYKILAYAPRQSDVEIRAELKYGIIHSKTTGNKKEVLNTPLIALAILGTDYQVLVSNSGKSTYVQVNQGVVKAGGHEYSSGNCFVVTPDGIKSVPYPSQEISSGWSGVANDENFTESGTDSASTTSSTESASDTTTDSLLTDVTALVTPVTEAATAAGDVVLVEPVETIVLTCNVL